MFKSKRNFVLFQELQEKKIHIKKKERGICFLSTLLFPIMMDSLKKLCLYHAFPSQVFPESLKIGSDEQSGI